jgi:hypothetical protein
LITALQASPGNESLRKMIADESDRGAELAAELIAEFELTIRKRGILNV